MLKNDRLVMVLSVQARDPRRWSPHELKLLEEVAERIWSNTERVRSDKALRETTAQLREARQRQDLAADAARLGVWEWGAQADLPLWENERMYTIFGIPSDRKPITLAELERDFLHPDDKEPLASALEEGWRTGRYRVACRITRASDGQLRWIEFSGRCETDAEGRPFRVVGVTADITERKRAEEHQNMLMAELDHRVKNILAVVQSIVRRSLGRGKTVGPEATDLLIGRLNALAQSHSLLASSRWEGARLNDILEAEVAPYRSGGEERVMVGGPNLTVTPKAAQALSLVLHELVTNAAKHGALSREGGRILVVWEIEGDRNERTLVFTWQEHGGPKIEQVPTRKGFGSLLIERTSAFELGGKAALDYAQNGLRATFELPLAGIEVEEGALASFRRSKVRSVAADPTNLQNKKVLVVEDEYLVAQETEERLRAAGCKVCGPVASLPEALRIAAADELDAAVLDVNLNGEFTWPVAEALRSRGIPLIFATGYAETIEPPIELRDVIRIEKPVRRQQLFSALASAMKEG